MKNENKTTPTAESVETFLQSIADPQQQADSRELVRIMQEVTGWPPVMWGASIIGFGTYHYKYPTGREGDTMIVGFSPRKQAISLYGLIYYDRQRSLAAKLGPHKEGKGCVYVKRLADIDVEVLKRLVASTLKEYT
jgi:hypothetical protein